MSRSHETRTEQPHFGPEREAELKGAISNIGGTPQNAAPPRTDLPAIAHDIPKLPPENWPAYDPTKPDTDFQLQEALTVVRAMPIGGARRVALTAGTRAARGPVVLRTLLWFWVPVLVVLGSGAGVLQVLGPPRAPSTATAVAAQPVAVSASPAGGRAGDCSGDPYRRSGRIRSPPPEHPLPGAAIPAPDPALLEPAADLPDASLPRIGSDGRMPMRVYAAALRCGGHAAARRPAAGGHRHAGARQPRTRSGRRRRRFRSRSIAYAVPSGRAAGPGAEAGARDAGLDADGAGKAIRSTIPGTRRC